MGINKMGIYELLKTAAQGKLPKTAQDGELKFDREEIRQRIRLGVEIGILLVTTLVASIYWIAIFFGPESKHSTPLLYSPVVMVRNNPPWTVITTIVTAPIVILLWYWRVMDSKQTIKLTKERQLNARFLTAIELLANPSMDSRVGAIYALDQLAKDSTTHHWPIIETLCAYLQNTAPINKPRNQIYNDVKAAQKVITRRKYINDNGYLDLRFTNLDNFDFSDGHFSEAIFNYALLNYTKFNKADLQSASFKKAKLLHAQFDWANLQYTNFSDADASYAYFSGDQIQYAIFHDATLNNALFYGARLKSFRAAKLLETFFYYSNLDEANFNAAELNSAKFSDTFLKGATFINADLSGAVFHNVDCSGCDFTRANLSDIEVDDKCNFTSATYSSLTKTTDFKPKEHGMILVDKDGIPVEQ